MPLRFFHRYNLLPGLTVNLSKGGISLTLGFRHSPQVTLSRKRMQTTIPLGIRGMYITKIRSFSSPKIKNRRVKKNPIKTDETMSFTQELIAFMLSRWKKRE